MNGILYFPTSYVENMESSERPTQLKFVSADNSRKNLGNIRYRSYTVILYKFGRKILSQTFLLFEWLLLHEKQP